MTASDIIIDQLKSSSVNGFPFFNYTGNKISSQTDNSLSLKAGSNPKGVSSITIVYDVGQDLYDIVIDGDKTEGMFASDMVDFIVDKMGVR